MTRRLRRRRTTQRLALAVAAMLTLGLGTAWAEDADGDRASIDRVAVDLPNAPTMTVVVPVAETIAVGGSICELQGPSWVRDGGDGTLRVDRAAFFPAWVRLRVGKRGCVGAPMRSLYVTRGRLSAAVEPTGTVLAEASLLEVDAPDLEGYDIVLLDRERVVQRTRCMGRRTCSAELRPEWLPSWLREGRTLRALLWPSAIPLTVGEGLPVIHDGAGWLAGTGFEVRTVRYEFLRPLLGATRVDGHSERTILPLTLPEALAAVRCRNARCALTSEGLEVFAVDAASLAVQVRLELRAEAVRVIGGRQVSKETSELEVVRCVMRLPEDTPLLGGVEGHGFAVALARDCLPAEANDLEVKTFPPTTAWVRGEGRSKDRAFRVFEIVFEKVPERISHLELTLRRSGPTGATLAAARVPVAQDFQPVGVRLDVGELGTADFLPRNRVAKVHLAFADPRWARDIRVVDRPGFYAVKDGGASLTGAPAATGSVPLRLVYAPAAMARMLRRAEPIAVFDTIARYPVRTLNVPLPLAGRKARTLENGRKVAAQPPVVRVYCRKDDRDVEIAPGRTASIAYEDRFGCRLVIDRNAIPTAAGEQRLRVRAPGLNEVITVSGRADAVELAITVDDREEFDVVHISVAHEYTGAHYDFSPRQSLGAEASWHLVLGDRSFRASVGTAMPTGLFRFGSDSSKGAVAFSAGGLARVHWLYKEGREFPIGIDFGILGTGLSSDPQLSVVTGLGFSVPVLNANTSLQASFNLHAWFEYSPTRTQGRTAFLFGPSFAVGKFSTNL